MTPKELAIKLIEHKVLRGDDIASIRRSWAGMGGPGYHVQIGGFVENKKYGSDKIIVREVDGVEVNKIFPLKTIFDRIKSPQQSFNF